VRVQIKPIKNVRPKSIKIKTMEGSIIPEYMKMERDIYYRVDGPEYRTWVFTTTEPKARVVAGVYDAKGNAVPFDTNNVGK
jgi:hypothetical protein